jgi:hypothetical protein
LGKRERWTNKTAMGCAVLILVPYLLLVGGWHMRNYLLTGDSAFSQVFANNMLFYRAAGVIALRDGISLEEAQARLRPTVAIRDGKVDSNAMMAQGLAIIREHPLLALRTQISGALTLLLGPGDGVFTRMLYTIPDGRSPSLDFFQLPLRQHLERWLWSKPLPFLAFLLSAAQLVVLYGGIGLWWGGTLWAKQRVASIHLLLWGIIVYFVVVTAGPEANSRFRVPLMPVLVMYAAAGLSWVSTLRYEAGQSNKRL